MNDTVYREVEVPCSPEEAWRFVLDPTWLGDDGNLTAEEGAEGWISEGSDTRYLVVEEVDNGRRLVYRWASFADEPTRVEIELAPVDGGTRIAITEAPLDLKAQATLLVR